MHDHSHEHSHGRFGRAFAIGIGLNLAYVAAEAFYGVTADSLALLADAGHNLGDVLGLAMAWFASLLSQRLPTARYTYGWRRSSILAALANAVLLLVVTGGLAWEGVRRLTEPGEPAGLTIIIVAALGIVINGVTALLFASGREGDLNIRGAFLHLAADAVVSAGTVLAGILILWTGKTWIDPVVSLVISVVIIIGTWSLLRDAVNLSLDAIPKHIEREDVENYLRALPGVADVHDLHIWALSTTDTALTAHLVCIESDFHLPARISDDVKRHFDIGHVTIQLETAAVAEMCRLRPDHIV